MQRKLLLRSLFTMLLLTVTILVTEGQSNAQSYLRAKRMEVLDSFNLRGIWYKTLTGENFASADLHATEDRYHNWHNNSLTVDYVKQLSLGSLNYNYGLSSFIFGKRSYIDEASSSITAVGFNNNIESSRYIFIASPGGGFNNITGNGLNFVHKTFKSSIIGKSITVDSSDRITAVGGKLYVKSAKNVTVFGNNNRLNESYTTGTYPYFDLNKSNGIATGGAYFDNTTVVGSRNKLLPVKIGLVKDGICKPGSIESLNGNQIYGRDNLVIGNHVNVFGSSNTASGSFVNIYGHNNKATGYKSFAFGNRLSSTDNVIKVGFGGLRPSCVGGYDSSRDAYIEFNTNLGSRIVKINTAKLIIPSLSGLGTSTLVVNDSGLVTRGITSANSWLLSGNTITSGQYIGSNNNTDLSFKVNSTETMRFFSSTKNVVIQNGGTFVDEGYRLFVNGAMRVNGMLNIKSTTGELYYEGNIRIRGVADSIQIGGSASGKGIAIGLSAAASDAHTTSIGNSSNAKLNSIAIGSQANAVNNGVAIGRYSKSLHKASICFNGAISEASNQFVAGNMLYPAGGENGEITEVYFGSGVKRGYNQFGTNTYTDGNGVSYSINGSGAYGTNFDGGSVTIAGGKGTGIGSPGDVVLATASTTTSGTTQQSVTNRWWVKGTTGYLGNNSSLTSLIDITGSNGYSQLRLRTPYTPTSSSDTNGNTGDISWDSNFIYIKTATGWKRSALTTF